jgi:transcriptional regulator with XRE-family HTH domain
MIPSAMSGFGTEQTHQPLQFESAYRGEPDLSERPAAKGHRKTICCLTAKAHCIELPAEAGDDQAMGSAKSFKAAANRARMGGPQRNDETVAHNIRRFRIARGLSQTELGEGVGVTFQQIQKYEKAKNAIPPGRLRQMCQILGIAPAEMFGSQPEVDGEPIPEMSRWSYRTLIALNKIKSERVRRSIGTLIEEMVGSQ